MIARWYKTDDLPALLTLFAACYPPAGYGEFTADDVAECLAGNDVIKLVDGLKPDGPVAFVIYGGASQYRQIRWLGTHPDYRRRGVAAFLIRCVIGPHVPPGRFRVGTFLRKDNQPGLALLTRLGFTTANAAGLLGFVELFWQPNDTKE